MVEWLQKDGLSIDDTMVLITSRVPNKIAEMYKRIFLRYQEEQRKYIRYGEIMPSCLKAIRGENADVATASYSRSLPLRVGRYVCPSFKKPSR